jgi:hypothetical protein
MKVKREDMKFTPVVITLESQREVDIITRALSEWSAARESPFYDADEVEADAMAYKIRICVNDDKRTGRPAVPPRDQRLSPIVPDRA